MGHARLGFEHSDALKLSAIIALALSLCVSVETVAQDSPEFPKLPIHKPKAGPPGVPVPYPNIGKSSDNEKGTTKVKIEKKPVVKGNENQSRPTIGAATIPQPTRLIARLTSDNRVALSWQDNSTDEVSFRFEQARSSQARVWQHLVTRPSSRSDIRGLGRREVRSQPFQSTSGYCFRIVAIGAAGRSTPSRPVCAERLPVASNSTTQASSGRFRYFARFASNFASDRTVTFNQRVRVCDKGGAVCSWGSNDGTPSVAGCRAMRVRVGKRVVAYGFAGKMLTASQLAQCNRSAR